ncbi:hypothetical protein [Streptomyces sp. NPDC050145]|uniref:hypothetical protein n=1 Tax=Streptomyces sp. NPDC050145 TaxID=3365602 RepID=UPI00378E6621
MASFTHVTPARCRELEAALTGARLGWRSNGRQDTPQFLTYTVTDPCGRTWRISPATNFQVRSTTAAQIWQAGCDSLLRTSPVLSARKVAELIHNTP